MNPEKPRLLSILNQLPLPPSTQWILSGSGVMVMHDIPRQKPMGDVDIFMATRPWFEILGSHDGWSVFTTDPEDPQRRADPPYLYKMVEGLEVNIFHAWRKRSVGDIDVGFWMNNTELVDGVPCVPLQFMLAWKMAVGRDKDSRDIETLRNHLGIPRPTDAEVERECRFDDAFNAWRDLWRVWSDENSYEREQGLPGSIGRMRLALDELARVNMARRGL